MDSTPTIHNGAKKEDVAKTVLMPGDPLRAKYIAENFLQDARQVNSVRGMLAYTGFTGGKRVTVMGSGMGIPSIALYSYELFNFYDVENIIRVGSTGALVEALKLNTVIIAIGASTDSNYHKQFNLPGVYTPPASFPLLYRAFNHAKELNIPAEVCTVVSSDTFYMDDPGDLLKWTRLGVTAVDMETAGLYLNAARHGKNALSLLTVTDNLVTHEEISSLDRERSLKNMITLALSLVE